MVAIIDNALYRIKEDGEREAFMSELMALPGRHERAITIFLDHAPMWKGPPPVFITPTR